MFVTKTRAPTKHPGEWILSVVATCRQQNCNVLELLTARCAARLAGSAAPSLLPAQAELAAA